MVFKWCLGSDDILASVVPSTISYCESELFFRTTLAELSLYGTLTGRLSLPLGMTALLSFFVGMTGNLSLLFEASALLSLSEEKRFESSIRSSVSKNVVEKFGRPH